MKAQDVKKFFDAHWTVRKYKDVTMPQEDLDAILNAAQRAPTDATAQMYSIIRLVDPQQRARIAELSGNAHIAAASESFIMCADLFRLRNILKLDGYVPGHTPTIDVHFAIGDAVMAGQNMLLAAEMLGYRGCWIGGVVSRLEEVCEALGLPHHVFPFAGLTLGVPDEAPLHRPRVARTLVVHENTYRIPSDRELRKSIEQMAPITARGNWVQTLSRYFGKGGSMEERDRHMQHYLQHKVFKVDAE